MIHGNGNDKVTARTRTNGAPHLQQSALILAEALSHSTNLVSEAPFRTLRPRGHPMGQTRDFWGNSLGLFNIRALMLVK